MSPQEASYAYAPFMSAEGATARYRQDGPTL